MAGRATSYPFFTETHTSLRTSYISLFKIYLLVSNLSHFKETTSSTNIRLLDLISTGNNGGSHSSGNTVVIGLSETAEGSDASLQKVVLGQVRDALLGDDNVRSASHNLHINKNVSKSNIIRV
jgi:hypothetical protein